MNAGPENSWIPSRYCMDYINALWVLQNVSFGDISDIKDEDVQLRAYKAFVALGENETFDPHSEARGRYIRFALGLPALEGNE